MSEQSTPEPTPLPVQSIHSDPFPVPTPEPTPAPTALPPEPTPEPVSVRSIIFAFIAAVVSAINTNCKAAGLAESETAVSELKEKIGDELTPAQHQHLNKVFAVLQEAPAPVSKVPAPPNDEAPVVQEPKANYYPGINTGPVK